MKRHHGFTLIETVAIVFIFALIVAIVLPIIVSQPRVRARTMQNNVNLRGIHSGMVLSAQGGRDDFPGFDGRKPVARPIPADSNLLGTASTDGTSVVYRMAFLLRGNFFSPEYGISPSETDPDIVAPVLGQNMLPGRNYSYAMLNVSQLDAGRNREWRATNNATAPILSDRNIGGQGSTTSTPSTAAQSIHSAPGEGWRGSVVYNDNHAVFETSDILTTEYETQGKIAFDGLFSEKEVTADGIHNADAAMVFKDNVSYSKQTAR